MFFQERPNLMQTRFLFLSSLTVLITWAIITTGCKHSSSQDEDERLEMDGTQKAIQQEFFMKRDLSLNVVPTERLLSAFNYMKTARTTRIDNLSWNERGPNNIGGRSRAILVDSRDATGNTVFAASVSGGLFKTTNFTSPTVTWSPVNDLLPNLAITCLVQDNANPLVMYAGTGEGWFNIDAVRGAGIFKSVDGGDTWNVLPSTIKTTPADSTFEYVQDLAIDNNEHVYASLRNLSGFSRGVKRSADGGATWTQVLGLPLTDLVYTTGRGADLEVASNGDVYATLGIFTTTMVLKSSFAVNGANTGAPGTWDEITPAHSETTYRGELSVAPSDPQRLYLMLQDSADDQVHTIYRSMDAGAHWSPFTAPTAALNNGTNSQTWYDLISAVDPSNPDVIVVGGIELAKSTDGGVTWKQISTSGTMHVDQHALVYFTSSRLLIGNDGGIYYSSDVSNTTPTFTAKNNGFDATQFYGCDFHPTDGNYFLAGAQDNNTQQFTDPGLNATSPVVGGDGGIPHIRQTDGLLQIAATTNNTYFRSLNGGGSFASLGSVNNNRGQFINPTDLDDNQNILYAGDDVGQYYAISGLATTPAGTVKTLPSMGDRGVTAVEVDPHAINTIWIGASNIDASITALPPIVIKVTSAASSTPFAQQVATIAAGNGAYISSVDVDPNNSNNVLATVSNFGAISVWESTNGGATFTNIEGNLPDMPVMWGLFAPPGAQLSGTTGGGIIIGTDLGVWTTSAPNGTSTQWIANNNGLANVPVYMIKYRPGNTSLVAATHGRGLFTATLTGVVTGVSNNVITKDFIKYIHPIPTTCLLSAGVFIPSGCR